MTVHSTLFSKLSVHTAVADLLWLLHRVYLSIEDALGLERLGKNG
jgi:hypothetical protein